MTDEFRVEELEGGESGDIGADADGATDATLDGLRTGDIDVADTGSIGTASPEPPEGS